VFVATLGAGDGEDWSPRDRRPVDATRDGRFLLFLSSREGLTPGDTATTNQLFEYDAQTRELVRVSQGEDGYNDNGNATGFGVNVTPVEEGQAFSGGDHHSSTNRGDVSEDGSTVAFQTSGRLSPLASSAEQGCRSVYEYRSRGRISNGGVRLISDGADVELRQNGGTCGAALQGMDASGANIMFMTADGLLPFDTDGVRDLYDARVDGGFPLPAVSAGCAGDACLGAPAASPVLSGAGSTAVAGGANLSGSPAGGVVVKAKPPSRAQRLGVALRACRRGARRGRRLCEARARRRYGAVKAVRANGRGK
jgi:hypothetical protein